MSLTRSMLKGMNLTEEQVSAIIEEHTNVTSALKEQIKQYKEDAEKLPVVQKELDDLKADGNDWKDKYEKEHTAFDDYKKEISTKETTAKVKAAYKSLLAENKIDSKCIDSILKVTDFSNMKLDAEGKIVDADKLSESIKKDWAGFIASTETKPSGDPATPPGDGGGKPKNTRAAELAAAYHENLYGKAKEN